jgi:uncharacterized membrane protein YoaK (UPF0700 family)
MAAGLAVVGGFADAASYVRVGAFSGHVTGNCVLAMLSLVNHDWKLLELRGLAVAVFVIGIAIAITVARGLSVRMVLLLEALLLVGAGWFPAAWGWGFLTLLSLAMGLQDGVMQRAEGIGIHTTFMTGLVTNLVDRLRRKRGGKKAETEKAKTGSKVPALLLVWTLFLAGAAGGVAATEQWGVRSAWVAAALVLALLADAGSETVDAEKATSG